jgi:hypothetical protein
MPLPPWCVSDSISCIGFLLIAVRVYIYIYIYICVYGCDGVSSFSHTVAAVLSLIRLQTDIIHLKKLSSLVSTEKARGRSDHPGVPLDCTMNVQCWLAVRSAVRVRVCSCVRERGSIVCIYNLCMTLPCLHLLLAYPPFNSHASMAALPLPITRHDETPNTRRLCNVYMRLLCFGLGIQFLAAELGVSESECLRLKEKQKNVGLTLDGDR